MKILLLLVAFMMLAGSAIAEIKYINSYSRGDGTYVSGHYRDTSNDGNPYNNANYMGLNGHRSRPEGIY